MKFKSYVPAAPNSATTFGDAPITDRDPTDYYGRYGVTPKPTLGEVMAVIVGHLWTAVAAAAIVGAFMLGIYTAWMIFNSSEVGLIITYILFTVFLFTMGIITFWHNTLDEWAVRHDRRAWDALHAQLHAARAAVAEAEAGNETERVAAAAAYNNLEREHRLALAQIHTLRQAQLSPEQQSRGSRHYKAETGVQRAAREIARAVQLGLPYTRDAICAGGRVEQVGWTEAMAAFARHGYATQRRKGGPWKITVPDVNDLLKVVDLPPDTTAPLDDEDLP